MRVDGRVRAPARRGLRLPRWRITLAHHHRQLHHQALHVSGAAVPGAARELGSEWSHQSTIEESANRFLGAVSEWCDLSNPISRANDEPFGVE